MNYTLVMNDEEKTKEQELQEWLDQVYFGSCCSHPADDEETSEDNESKTCSDSEQKELQ